MKDHHRQSQHQFLSTPSARRATTAADGLWGKLKDFYPRPPRGGRQRREHRYHPGKCISIHALREEGDTKQLFVLYDDVDFYPRPPRGGRLIQGGDSLLLINFYPRPPRGGRRPLGELPAAPMPISIHALREEGDDAPKHYPSTTYQFLSTPSARRATERHLHPPCHQHISIHALREEGDSKNRDKISIFKQIIQHSARI